MIIIDRWRAKEIYKENIRFLYAYLLEAYPDLSKEEQAAVLEKLWKELPDSVGQIWQMVPRDRKIWLCRRLDSHAAGYKW